MGYDLSNEHTVREAISNLPDGLQEKIWRYVSLKRGAGIAPAVANREGRNPAELMVESQLNNACHLHQKSYHDVEALSNRAVELGLSNSHFAQAASGFAR